MTGDRSPVKGSCADGDRLLADVEVKKATHVPLIVMFQCLLLEASDAEHLAEEVDLLRRLEARIEK